MDKKLHKIEREVKGGKKKAALKDLTKYEVADKKRDKYVDLGKKVAKKEGAKLSKRK